jgi:hypothetical protein
MLPSQQSLASRNRLCVEIEDWLKYQKKLTAMKAISEVAFEDPTLSRCISGASVEKLNDTTGSMLGVIESFVSAF